MIADSPYDAGDLALSPRVGVAAGVVAALVLVLVITAWPGDRGGASGRLHPAWWLALGAAGGLLYAMAQRRVPSRSMLAVGVFYGVVLWAIGGLAAGWVLGDGVRRAVHSTPGFVGHALYGLTLAGQAVWIDRRRPPSRSAPFPD